MLTINSLTFGWIHLSIFIFAVIFFAAVAAAVIFSPKIYRFVTNHFLSDEKSRTTILPGDRKPKKASKAKFDGKINFDALEEIIDTAGYAYNPEKDIFFSTMEAWQRKMGYCRLYDEAAAPLGMIVDCEPIYFTYNGKRWLIELWKGQYGMTTGCEIGIYTTAWPDLNIPDVFNGTFYRCASDSERLYMQFSLKKNGEKLLSRKHKHWWLTGFKLGEFSYPSELVLDVYITFKDRKMRNAFVTSLREIGYTDEEYEISGRDIAIRFDKPHTKQPYSRTPQTDEIVLKRNKMFCDQYNLITSSYSNIADKIIAVKEQSPELYKEILNIGKTLSIFDTYAKIKHYLENNSNYNLPSSFNSEV
ncbi:uncharacterized protein DUF4474 [Ruminiclostridium sufflavum DSM 19573]|uniref:Uncharacterized protein DUF4474 n=1 Tax=Ruminiclostridium sufflavum DSM 19573 TaxID=1121337 RepID=A0A318XWN8_9FIRM|nr:DUF4474 domain-containing protein [Ruminiclostridium sufflavum]PYG87217.1 uncharacterized protein DUF4474 [Ruminiclostridium sufflavum DSM 19573]